MPRLAAAAALLATTLGACGSSGGPDSPASPDAAAQPAPDGATPDPDAATTGGPYDRARVMFSGHSLINRNTPAYLAQLARAAGLEVGVQAQLGNGSTMSLRLSCPRNGEQADGAPPSFRILDELARPGAYDTLIVTERHDIVLAIAYEDSTSMARHFHDAFVRGAPAGRPFLYESWWSLDRADPAAWRARVARERVAWDCVASRVNLARASGTPALRVLPAATALSALVGEVLAGTVPGMTTLDAVFTDDVHLTPAGNYFIALVDLAIVYERSPVGLPHALQSASGPALAIGADTAARLQAIAWREAQAAIAEPGGHLRSQAACEAALATLCPQTPGTNAYTCTTALPPGFGRVDTPVRTITESWCLR